VSRSWVLDGIKTKTESARVIDDSMIRPFWRHFVFHTQVGCVVRLCIKFEADCSNRSKVIKGVPKIVN